MCLTFNFSVVNHSINIVGDAMYYTDRLQWIRDCKNITQKEVAQALRIKQQQYARYEKGINVMPITYLALICKYLDISADYLLGLIDEPLSLKEKEKLTKI